jgi:uncharacterized alpha-E superfamily protein
VVEFVVLRADFPRSLAYCVDNMGRALERIGTLPDGAVPDALQALRAHLAGTNPQAILEGGLHEYLERFLVLLARLTQALQEDYFEAHLGEAL